MSECKHDQTVKCGEKLAWFRFRSITWARIATNITLCVDHTYQPHLHANLGYILLQIGRYSARVTPLSLNYYKAVSRSLKTLRVSHWARRAAATMTAPARLQCTCNLLILCIMLCTEASASGADVNDM